MNTRGIKIFTLIFLLTGSNVFALSGEASKSEAPVNNGGNIFQQPVDKIQQNRDNEKRRAEAARKKTEELNKKWRAEQRKAEKAKAKAKREAEKKKKAKTKK